MYTRKTLGHCENVRIYHFWTAHR